MSAPHFLEFLFQDDCKEGLESVWNKDSEEKGG